MSKFSGPVPTVNTGDQALRIIAAGLCCAVGYHLEAATCALRANIDNFQESEFLTDKGERVVVARLFETDLWGQSRLARWLEFAIKDCLQHVRSIDTREVPVVWLAPEQDRQGVASTWWTEVFNEVTTAQGLKFHPKSGVMARGRAGLAEALQQASNLLNTENCPAVMLIGVDSYLHAATINHYLKADRLQISGNSDGFIPGEAAAAVLLTTAGTTDSGVKIMGYQHGHEVGRPDGSVPCRAQGLSETIRAALASSQTTYAQLDFRVSDQNGEVFFAKEAANAISRVAPRQAHRLPVLTVCDCLGEIGAATGPSMLAYLSRFMTHPDSPGRTALLHLANDDGRRSAVVIQYQPA
jgi:3-oxoacyl-[acyl-carrier-protein] synthase I